MQRRGPAGGVEGTAGAAAIADVELEVGVGGQVADDEELHGLLTSGVVVRHAEGRTGTGDQEGSLIRRGTVHGETPPFDLDEVSSTQGSGVGSAKGLEGDDLGSLG